MNFEYLKRTRERKMQKKEEKKRKNEKPKQEKETTGEKGKTQGTLESSRKTKKSGRSYANDLRYWEGTNHNDDDRTQTSVFWAGRLLSLIHI